MWKRKIILFAAAVCAAAMLTGCAFRLTTGFGQDTVAKVNGDKIGMDSAMLLLSEMLKRDRALVELCDVLVAVYSGSAGGGTAYTVRYAQKNKRHVSIIKPLM